MVLLESSFGDLGLQGKPCRCLPHSPAAQERLEDHRRQEASRALVVSERETVRSAVLAAIQRRLAGVKGLLPVLRTLKVPVEGDPAPSHEQILKCAFAAASRCGLLTRMSVSCSVQVFLVQLVVGQCE